MLSFRACHTVAISFPNRTRQTPPPLDGRVSMANEEHLQWAVQWGESFLTMSSVTTLLIRMDQVRARILLLQFRLQAAP